MSKDGVARYLRGNTFEIIVEPAALTELTNDFVARGQNACGLLLGSWTELSTDAQCTISKTLSLEDDAGSSEVCFNELIDILRTWPESQSLPAPVGIYSCEDNPERFYFYELRHIHEHFHGPGSLALCIQETADGPLGSVIACLKKGTEVLRENVPLSIPVAKESAFASQSHSAGPAAAAARARPPKRPRHFLDPTAFLPSDAPTLNTAPAVGSTLIRSKTAIAVLLLAGISAVGIWWFLQSRQITPVTEQFATQPVRPSNTSGLDLRVSRQGGDLEITWDRNSPAAQSAQAGFLYIIDGGQRTEVFLEEAHLKTGRVLYSPRSADLDIRLELITGDQKFAREALRILQGGTGRPQQPTSDLVGRERTVQQLPASKSVRAESPLQHLQPSASQNHATATEAKRVFLPPTSQRPTLPVGTARIETLPPPEVVPSMTPHPIFDAPLKTTLQLPGPPPPQTADSGGHEQQPVPPVAVALHDRIAPVPIQQFPASVPPQLRSLLTTEVVIPVHLIINQNGYVESANTDPQNSVLKTNLAAVALSAAKSWRFAPATRQGHPIKSPFTLVFRFKQ